jgi:hypothetical protein
MCADLLHSLAGIGQCPEKACDGAAGVSKKKEDINYVLFI